MADWIAAGTAYSVPRRADGAFLHLLLDVRPAAHHGPVLGGCRPARPRLLIGGTAGRTTLNGEGLQHEDGHSQVLANMMIQLHQLRPDLPVRSGRSSSGRPAPHVRRTGRRLLPTVMNENYEHPEMPEGAEADIIRDVRLPRRARGRSARPAAGFRHHLQRSHRRRRLLKNDWGVGRHLGLP